MATENLHEVGIPNEVMQGEAGWVKVRTMVFAGGLTVAALVGGTLYARQEDDQALMFGAIADSEETAQPTDDTSAEDEVCSPTWEMPGVEINEKSRWFADGIQEIKDAETEDDARAALHVWIYGNEDHPGVRDDAMLLATAHKTITPLFITEGVVFAEPEDLVGEDGCATERAQELVLELEGAIALANVTPVDEITEDGYNTGLADYGVTVSGHSGISGDTKSISITNEDGCSVYVLARCGQLYFSVDCDVPNLPEGPTDNPPVAETPPEVETPNDKKPKPLDGPHQNPGSGGEPEQGMDPQNDSDTDGYGPDDSKPNIPDDTAPNQTTGSTTPATTGPPRPTAPPSPVTTEVTPPNDTMPPVPQD